MTRNCDILVAVDWSGWTDLATTKRMTVAKDTVTSALRRQGSEARRWTETLLDASHTDSCRVTLELDAWRSQLFRTREDTYGPGQELNLVVWRENRTAEKLDQGQSVAWVASLTAEALSEAATRYSLGPAPDLSAWAQGVAFPFVRVEAIGSTGAPDKSWHRNPDIDDWLHLSRLVCDTINLELERRPVTSVTSPELLLSATSSPVSERNLNELGSGASIVVDRNFKQLREAEKQQIVVTDVEQTVRQRGARDGFDPDAVLTAARASLTSADSALREYSTWEREPDHGQHQARWLFEEDWSGVGRMRIEIADLKEQIIARSGWAPAGPTVFAARCNYLVWETTTRVLVEWPHPKGKVRALQAMIAPRDRLKGEAPPANRDPESTDVTADDDDFALFPAHPDFTAHFTHEMYEDDGNDLAPFGSDEGADILADATGVGLHAGSTVRDLLSTGVDDVDAFLADTAANAPDEDAVIIGAAFALLRLTGQIDSEGRRWVTQALERTRRCYNNPEAQQMLDDLQSLS